ncbi:MAG TPA: hypothetical protein VGL93_07675 [Streptosporangiaceae bacterium]|jgi:hypothetical protein
MSFTQFTTHTNSDGSTLFVLLLRTDQGAGVTCREYGGMAPTLVIDGPGAHVEIAPDFRDRVTDGDLAFARALAAEATHYAVECERIHIPDIGDVPGFRTD